MTSVEPHRRSVAFLEREGITWACFLVTFQEAHGRWKGYFSFRRRDGDPGDEEVRTTDIFLESSEAEIDRKARGLGRPLLTGLLSSALHRQERDERGPPRLREWFHDMLCTNSRELSGRWEEEPGEPRDLTELRSIYASYRLDQVAHLITLVRPADFQDAVSRILDGQSFDFSARDRLQFAMMVVERIEALLPLPPFEVWAEDYLANEDAYRMYAHALHRESGGSRSPARPSANP